jgi:hypothetical protein
MSEKQEELKTTDVETDFTREVVDRRTGGDRRQTPREASNYDGPDRRVASRRTGLERRRGAGIRREEDRRSAEEGEMTPEQFEFVQAMETYKRKKNKPFPNWVDVLEVVTALGYQSVEVKTIDFKDAPKSMQDTSDLTVAQAEFVRAVETYKHVNKKRFPTWTEVLEVVDQLGYRKMTLRELELPNVPEAPIYKKAA